MKHIITNVIIPTLEPSQYCFDDLCEGCFFYCGDFLYYKFYASDYNAIKISTAEKYCIKGDTIVVPVDVEIKVKIH